MIVWIFTVILHLATGPVTLEYGPFPTYDACQTVWTQTVFTGLIVGWDKLACRSVTRP